MVTVWPEAREATAQVRPRRRDLDEVVKRERGTVLSAEHRERATRRAVAEIRRTCAAHRLAFLHTLTFAPIPGGYCEATEATVQGAVTVRRAEGDGVCSCGRPIGAEGFDAAMAEAERFVRRLRYARGGETFPYVLVAEPHADRHWHVHVSLPFQVERERLSDLWGLGRVDDGFRPEDRKRLRSFGEQAALAGVYCGKYVGKGMAWLGEHLTGRQAYRRAEGYAVRKITLGASDEREARTIAVRLMRGAEVVRSWDSDEVEDWDGPRTWCWRFGWEAWYGDGEIEAAEGGPARASPAA